MNLYNETKSEATGRSTREWSYCHPSGYAGTVIENFFNGIISTRQFITNGCLHRPTDDGPAYESFLANGAPKSRSFYINGLRHRPVADGPAYECFDYTGTLESRLFYVDGRLVAEYVNP